MNSDGGLAGVVMIFARAPRPGACKTRLIPVLGARGAALLAERLLAHTLRLTQGRNAELWVTPDCGHAAFERARRSYHVPCMLQGEGDLGDRMSGAFAHALRRAPWAVIIGSDCPELQPGDLDAAGAALERGADAVLGPASDGGYYLLGLRAPHQALFEDMPWGSPRLIERTRAVMRALRLRCEELAVRRDVDEPEDLRALAPQFPFLETEQC